MSCVDDEPDQLTCYDQEGVSTPGEAAAGVLQELEPSNLISSSGQICPKCLLFWLVVIAVVFGILYYRK
jgi:hypothetical protein